MNNPGSSTTGNKPATRNTATSTTATSTTGTRPTGTRTTGTGTTGTGTNTTAEPRPRIVEQGLPGVRIVTAEPRSGPSTTSSATRPPASPRGGISAGTLGNIVSRIAKAFDGKSYAIIGSAAEALLDIGPSGHSVDVLVPPGASSKRAEKLCLSRGTSRFGYSVSLGEAYYMRENGGKDIPVRFWEPKQVHQECPHEISDLVMVGDVRVLKPTLLLNIHCYIWQKYQSGPKKDAGRANGAAQSIDLLVKHIVKQTKREVSNATGDFLAELAVVKPETYLSFADLGIKTQNR